NTEMWYTDRQLALRICHHLRRKRRVVPLVLFSQVKVMQTLNNLDFDQYIDK
ncbi:hypothetical protein BgiMline_034414, partial [Biomphalaria glabrata]